MAKSIIKPTVVLLVICIVVSGLLALTYVGTYDQIEKQNQNAVQQAIVEVLPGTDTYRESSLKVDGGESSYYTCMDSSGMLLGYVFQTISKGYGGDIEVMTGITLDGEVTGVELVSESETAGLGKKANEEDFRDQYKQAVPENGFTVVKGTASNPGEIDAISGATITSDAVTNAVNQAVDLFNRVNGGAD